MLLTLPLRQGLVGGLRANGATRLDIVQALLFDALVLGGLAAARWAWRLAICSRSSCFARIPGYLSFAFPVGSQRIVTWQSIAIAAGAGLLAACVGVLIPLREIFSASGRTADVRWASHRPLVDDRGLDRRIGLHRGDDRDPARRAPVRGPRAA